ncbi:MAG: ADP-ribosylglycohydrolase family protein, partial [Clostridia bacterium]|nr:ADP-ribosylglycohydrolase family protein [Clostridia bacterium]
MKEKYTSRIRGCLLGGAVGDALGYPVEFMSLADIKRRYGEAGITQYEFDSDSGFALISDDTQMTLFTANGLLSYETALKTKGFASAPLSYVLKAYRDWYACQMAADVPKNNTSWLSTLFEMHDRRAPGLT